MKKYKLYLFDFDGTILNTMPALEVIFSKTYEHVGMKFDPKDTVYFSRIPSDVGYKILNGDPEKFEEFCKYLEIAIDLPEALVSNHPYEETYEFLEYVKLNHIRTGIVTSNRTHHVKDVLKVMDIPEDSFDIYVGNKEYEKFKPHPDPILKALEIGKYDGDLTDVVYIGDAMNDALSAISAGVNAVIIDREDEYPDSDKYVRIHNLMELFK